MREICERYELHRPLWQQLAMVHRSVLRLAFPGGKPRPKPGPFRREEHVPDVAEPAAA